MTNYPLPSILRHPPSAGQLDYSFEKSTLCRTGVLYRRPTLNCVSKRKKDLIMARFRFVVFACMCLCLSLPMAVNASVVWFSTSENLIRVDATTNTITQTLPIKDIASLAVDSQSAAWIVTAKQVSKISFDGTTQFQSDLRALGLKEAPTIAVNPYDNSVWLVDQKTALRLDVNGRTLTSISLAGTDVRQIQVAQDESLWILGNKQLAHYSPSGLLIAGFDLHAIANAEPKYFVVDDIGGSIWLAGEKQLIQVDLASAQHVLRRVALVDKVLGLVMQPRTGAIWVLGDDSLGVFDVTGTLVRDIDLKGQAIKGIDTLVLDAVADSVWVTQKAGVARFSASTGNLLAEILTQKSAEEAGAAPFTVLPQISLLRPQRGLLSNNALPTFALQYDASCNGQPCGFTNAYLGTYVLSAMINNQAYGNLFVFDLATGKATLTPATRLPEGTNTFSAQVRDRFGHLSNTVNSTFMIDTVPPSFLEISPGTSLITNRTPLRVTGRLSEPATLRSGLVAVPVAPDGSFSYDQALAEGVNDVALVAQDLAGNQATRTLSITLDTVAPEFVDLMPVTGTLTNLSSIAITGKLSEAAVLTLGTASLALANDNSFARTVPLVEGTNAFVLKATDRAGNVATRTINVIRDTVAPKLLNISPANGTSVNLAQVRISGAFDDAKSVTLTGAGGMQTANGAAFAFDVTLQSGANVFALRAIDGAGNVTQENLTLTWVAYDPIDAPFMSVWDGMIGSLTVGDKTGALSYLSHSAKIKYDPVFDALMSDMSQIARSFSSPKRVSIGDDLAEYAVNRVIDGVDRIFLISFVRDSDGVWRIDQM